jgi:hypothetical protein
MDDDEKHLVEDAEKVLEKTKRFKSHEVEESNGIFLQWFYWSSVFLGELEIPEHKIHYFIAAYIESTREVQSSIVLALHGSYKNAVQILRNWLELVVAGIYYDHHTAEGKDWEEKGHHIHFGEFKKSLSQRDKVLSAETASDISSAWKRLSEYVHSHAYVLESVSARSGYGAIAPEYNREYFEKWFDFLKEMYKLCSILLVENIPEVLESEKIEEFFEPTVVEKLKRRITNK